MGGENPLPILSASISALAGLNENHGFRKKKKKAAWLSLIRANVLLG